MNDLLEGKLRICVEIRHKNNDVTICFMFIDDEETVYDILNGSAEFILVELLNQEIIYIAKSDIKAFKMCDTDKDEIYNIWSFDPYAVLGVEASIDSQSLQERYISLLKKTHPDVIDTNHLHPAFKSLATDMTRRILSAFEFVRSELSAGQEERRHE
ncbi:MAG: J domain-containing protein [Pseudomonadota bacterium]